MILESVINFAVGDKVIFNPDNHGYKNIGNYEKVKDRIGVVRFVESFVHRMDDGGFVYKESGRISVEWEGDFTTRIVNYKRLKRWVSQY